jgi:hypothetical protein
MGKGDRRWYNPNQPPYLSSKRQNENFPASLKVKSITAKVVGLRVGTQHTDVRLAGKQRPPPPV